MRKFWPIYWVYVHATMLCMPGILEYVFQGLEPQARATASRYQWYTL